MKMYDARTKRLLHLIDTLGLSDQEIARLTDRKPATVEAWRYECGGRPIPKSILELLEMKVGGRRA